MWPSGPEEAMKGREGGGGRGEGESDQERFCRPQTAAWGARRVGTPCFYCPDTLPLTTWRAQAAQHRGATSTRAPALSRVMAPAVAAPAGCGSTKADSFEATGTRAAQRCRYEPRRIKGAQWEGKGNGDAPERRTIEIARGEQGGCVSAREGIVVASAYRAQLNQHLIGQVACACARKHRPFGFPKLHVAEEGLVGNADRDGLNAECDHACCLLVREVCQQRAAGCLRRLLGRVLLKDRIEAGRQKPKHAADGALQHELLELAPARARHAASPTAEPLGEGRKDDKADTNVCRVLEALVDLDKKVGIALGKVLNGDLSQYLGLWHGRRGGGGR